MALTYNPSNISVDLLKDVSTRNPVQESVDDYLSIQNSMQTIRANQLQNNLRQMQILDEQRKIRDEQSQRMALSEVGKWAMDNQNLASDPDEYNKKHVESFIRIGRPDLANQAKLAYDNTKIATIGKMYEDYAKLFSGGNKPSNEAIDGFKRIYGSIGLTRKFVENLGDIEQKRDFRIKTYEDDEGNSFEVGFDKTTNLPVDIAGRPITENERINIQSGKWQPRMPFLTEEEYSGRLGAQRSNLYISEVQKVPSQFKSIYPDYEKITTSLNSGEQVIQLINIIKKGGSGAKQASSQLESVMPRLLGEVGNLTQYERQSGLTSQSLIDRANQSFSKWGTGKLTKENILGLEESVNEIINIKQKTLKQMSEGFIESRSSLLNLYGYGDPKKDVRNAIDPLIDWRLKQSIGSKVTEPEGSKKSIKFVRDDKGNLIKQ